MAFTPLVSYQGANSGRGLSPGLWAKQPRDFQDLSVGFGIQDDFLTFDDENKWVLTQATAGTVALDVAAKGGVLLLDSNSTTITKVCRFNWAVLPERLLLSPVQPQRFTTRLALKLLILEAQPVKCLQVWQLLILPCLRLLQTRQPITLAMKLSTQRQLAFTAKRLALEVRLLRPIRLWMTLM